MFATTDVSAQLSGGFKPGLFAGAGTLDDDNPASWIATYYSTDKEGIGVLEVEVELADEWHVGSVTQAAGGPLPTKITLQSPGVSIIRDFEPSEEPHESESPYYDVTLEQHSGGVVWTAGIRMPAGYKEDLKVNVSGLTCKDITRCVDFNEVVIASFGGDFPDEVPADIAGDNNVGEGAASRQPNAMTSSTASEFRDKDYYVAWTASVEPESAKPGQTAKLKITAKSDPTYHIYREATDDSAFSTIFVVTEKSELKVGAPIANKPPLTQHAGSSLATKVYDGEVTWTLPIQIPADLESGTKQIEGMIYYAACDENSCADPKALSFVAKVNVGDSVASEAASSLVTMQSADPMAVETINWVDEFEVPSGMSSDVKLKSVPAEEVEVQETAGAKSFPLVLLFAFLGGFVLNFMPCVLPVIGLKVMSFVGQGGEDRKRIFALNLAYAGGICFVFAVLAFLAIAFSFSWGQQFQYFSVRLGVTIGLFAFALSYFNVWEIPVPGMAAGKTSQELQSKEGFAGAFSKGIFTTLLATPCSGPLLGGVFGATLGMASPQIALVFAMLALGMSSPYLAIGLKPGLVKFLPKPGPWMETFKQLMAFLFLAAVAYFFYQFSDENKFPVFVTLMGVWFGCWIIGQVPNWDAIGKRLVAWIGGVGIATAIGFVAFTSLKEPPILNWVDYDEVALQHYQAEGKTVLVDFSAKWCVNCLVNLETAIDTEATRRVVEQNDVVTMYADKTNPNEAINAKLKELNSNSIPVLAIYPAGKPNEPIVLRDLLTQNMVLEALKEAGPSRNTKSVALLSR